MIGHKPNWFFVLSWKFTSPVFLLVVIIMSILNSQTVTYYGYEYPFWATFFGWCFTLSSISAIPIYALIWFCRNGRARGGRIKTAVAVEETRAGSMMLTNHYITGSGTLAQTNIVI